MKIKSPKSCKWHPQYYQLSMIVKIFKESEIFKVDSIIKVILQLMNTHITHFCKFDFKYSIQENNEV